MKPKKRNGGKKLGSRKAFTVRLSLSQYNKFCDLAGTRSLSDALEMLIQSRKTRIPEQNAPPSHE
ncbi:MAG: hypothetical protein WA708_00060 [Acidobacteriaceae bacterium]